MPTRQITFRLDADGNVDQVVSKAGNAFTKLGEDVNRASQAANTSLSTFGKLASGLGGVATVAGGIVAANVFNKIAEGIGAFVSVGLQSVDAAQRLETGLGALLSMNNMYERVTTTSTVAIEGFAEAQADAAEKSADLAFEQKKLGAQILKQQASIQEQKQRIIQMGEGLNKNEAVAQLGVMEVALEGLQRELAQTGQEQGKLSDIQQEYTTVTKTGFEQVMNLADAQKLAADQSKDLLAYIEKLAIISPFEQDQVAIVAKLATAAGLGVEQTKSFTAGFLDLAAAVGIGSESLDFAADQLLQVAKVGKITSVDLRQLRRLGIDLEKIIGVQMGMSIEEFNKKAGESPEIFNELFDSVTKFSQNTFAGTAEKMATSLSGLKSTTMDIFKVGAKNLMRPLIEAIGPAASEMLGKLSDIVTGPAMAKVGEAIPKVLFGAFKVLSGEKGALDVFTGLRDLGLDTSTAKYITGITRNIGGLFKLVQAGDIKGLAGALGFDPGLVDQAKLIITDIKTAINAEWGSMASATSIMRLGTLLGIDPKATATVLTAINNITANIEGGLAKITGAYERFGAKGAVVSISGMLGLDPETIGNIRTVMEEVSVIVVDGITKITDGTTSLVAAFSEGGLTQLAGEFLAGIPTTLTNIATGIANFLAGPAVPIILEGISEWGTKFWEWTTTAIEGVGLALGGILLAISAWVASPEAQTQLNSIGNSLGQYLVTGIGMLFDQQDQWGMVLLKVAGGLLAAAAVIVADLALVGGQIVAGMLSGILEALGIDLQPATLTELTTILNQIGTDLYTIQTVVGEELVKAMQTGMENAWTGFKSAIKALIPTITPAFADLALFILPIFEDTFKEVKDVFSLDKWMEVGQAMMDGLLKGIEENSGSVLEALKALVNNSLSTFTGGFEVFSPSRVTRGYGQNLIEGLTVGARQAASGLYSTLSGITQSSLNTLMTGMRVTDSGFIDRFIDDLDMGGIGKAAGAGGGQWRNFRNILHNEIRAGMSGLEAGSIDFMSKITEVASRFNFPPNLAREFAKAEGLVEHLTGTFGTMFTRMRIENLGQSIGLANQFASIGQSFADMVTEQIESAAGLRTELDKLTSESDKLNKIQTDYQEKLVNLNADLLKLTQAEEQDTEAIRRKKEAIDELTLQINENQAAIEANTQAAQKQRKELELMAFSMFDSVDQSVQSQTAMVDLLQEFINSQQESLFIQADEMSQAAGITGIIYDRVSAQAELNRLLEEQAQREQEILQAQQAQQQLNFLQQQISLLDMLSSRGLNPADILGGITLGLEASASDLLAATNAVVEAMISQINSDLQMHSPSKVMMGIGQNITDSLAQGVGSGKKMLAGAMSGMAGVVTRPFGGGTYNNTRLSNSQNTSQTIIVNNPSQRVMGDLMMLRAKSSRV